MATNSCLLWRTLRQVGECRADGRIEWTCGRSRSVREASFAAAVRAANTIDRWVQ
ncbi:hypothetical protein ACFQZZ_18175 [Nocardia sp. GCM10030253]|uniref:hypothetical protein n=1 Tax=Nocardia sp. GCM10030253 TaxID=3273404 RepID=UPI0036421639